MSQNGYQKFFKEARKNSSVSSAETPRRFVTAEQLDQMMSQTRTKKNSPPPPLVSDRQRKISARKKSSAATKVMITLSFVGIGLALGALSFDDQIEKALSKVEIEFFGMTPARAEKETTPAASSKEKKEAAAEQKETNETAKASSGETVEEGAEKGAEKVQASGGENDHLLTLAQRKKELDQRDEDLKQTESQIQEQKKELDKKIAELEETRRKIASILEERVKVDEQKVETLVQMYSNMRAPQAAKIFETMDEGLVVEILGRMKKKNAADVMNLIKPEKAQIFSEKLAGYRTNK